MNEYKRMRSLVEITRIVTQSDNFYEVKDQIINNMLAVVHPTKACVNLFYNNDYNYAHLVCSSTLNYIPKIFPQNEEYGAKIDFSVYPDYIHEAVEEKKVVIVDDIFKNEKAKGEENLAINEGYIGRAIFPFIINDKVIGFMTCYLSDQEKLKPEDIDFITQVASMMSLSISITEKNDGINKLIGKLRQSITNINKASKRLFSTQDIFYYLQKMANVVADTTDSKFSMVNIYNIGENGGPMGQKFTCANDQNAINSLAARMPIILKDHRIYDYGKTDGEVLVDGKSYTNRIFYKVIIDSKSMLVILAVGDKVYTEDDFNIIGALAKQIATSVKSYDYSEKLEENKAINDELVVLKHQQKLIMDNNSLKKFADRDLFYFMKPAKVVGGDFYHSMLVDDRVIFILADVMGHGIVANYMVALIKGAFEVLVRKVANPKEIITKLNKNLYNEFDNMGAYATIVVGSINKNTNKLELANAGHYQPIIFDNDNKYVEIDTDAKGIPIGIINNEQYSQIEIDFSKDKCKAMCMFTDGIIEMKNQEHEEFGHERLVEFLSDNIDSDEKTIKKRLDKLIKHFSVDDDKKDDILLAFIK
jgi:serine phosphatase RsbU (regulator of sigma subunit)|nr:GAF domain-containing SpoIIE family protein phosphatase [uncultured Peptostreptococcus sp.]